MDADDLGRISIGDEIALTQGLHVATQYGQCQSCHYVMEHAENFTNLSVSCPECRTVESRIIWPGQHFHLLQFEALQNLYRQREKFGPVVVVLAFAMTEGMLRRCTEDALRKHGANRWAASETLSQVRGANATMSLLAKLYGERSLNIALKETDLKMVVIAWNRAREVRNIIAHGRSPYIAPEDVENAFAVCVQFPNLLRQVLNKIPEHARNKLSKK